MSELRDVAFNELDQLDFDKCSLVLGQVQRTFPNAPSGSSDINFSNQKPRFAELKVVGLGAFGVVFSAIDQDLNGKRIAIKILRPSKAQDNIAKQRFYDEAQNTAELVHPCIVTVYSIGEVDSIPYIVESLADRGSLAELLRANPTYFSCDQAAWLIMKLAEGLHYAHTNGTLHRDVKTGNILLRSDHSEWIQAGSFWPMLSDFGLSKKVEEVRSRALTITGEVLGTVAYMSPEQVLSKKTTTQSDLFSMGIIFHEILYGVHPFLVESDYKTRRNIVESGPIKTSVKGIPIPEDLAAIIDKCLNKQADERYTSAKDLAIDLKCFLDGQPVSVRPPNSLQSARMLVHRHPIASTSLATLFASLLVFAIFLGREWQVQRLLAEERQKISQLFLESIQETNTGMNDTILAGERVDVKDLLAILEKQIPRLEVALEIDPGNRKLVNNLRVMLHYASICNYTIAISKGDGGFQETIRAASLARKRSLEYIDRLLESTPDEKKLLGARINGEYWMALLEEKRQDSPQSGHWHRQAILHAQNYLDVYPDDESIIEILSNTQANYCNAIQDQSPDEALAILRGKIDWNLTCFEQDSSSLRWLVASVESLTDRGEILVRQARLREAEMDFSHAEDLIANRYRDLQRNWNVRNVLISHYLERCLTLFEKGYADEVVSVAQRWREYVQSHDDWSNNANAGGFRQSIETHYLFATYYWYLGVNHSETTSGDEKKFATSQLRDAIAKCAGNPKVNMDLMTEALKRMKVPTESLEREIDATP
jgi:serine/threonine protein kinase